MYSLKKRALSVISALLGFILSLGAIFAVVLSAIDMLKETPAFSIGESLTKLGINLDFSSTTIQWIIVFATLVVAIINLLLCVKLIKKPMEIDEKFPNLGVAKVFFVIFTLTLGMISPMQIFSKNILADDMLYIYIVLGVTVFVVLLQIISMFIAINKKQDNESEEKANDKETTEIVEVCEQQAEPCICEQKVVACEQSVVPIDGRARTMFNSIANDPILDGFENRVREVKHLRDAGLINDQQASAAVENIIDGFLR